MPGNLPVQSTSFVGREEQIAEIARLLPSARLLTLTGAGGCGKTRLALRVAARESPAYDDGAWFVDLAAVADGESLPQAAAAALGVREVPGQAIVETVLDHLRDRSILLVLDNCEHVVNAAAQLADGMLRTCPRVRILATSREPLRVGGEVTWRVPSLSLPASGASLADAMRSEAARLFVERAQAAVPDLTLAAADLPALEEICRRLDGIPLAIELAAASVRAFSLSDIAVRLDDRFRLLTGGSRTAMPRQQTLRATVDWSYALLSEPERAVLRRLSVFAGGWTLDAAEAVAGVGVLDLPGLLASLIEKSTVVADRHAGAMRYRLLETIRQYARERLREAGEERRTRERHLAYFLALAEQAELKLRGPEASAAFERLEQEHDNLRLALEGALQWDPEAVIELAAALAWFWWDGSHHAEGRRWLARVLAANPAPAAARMKALHGAAWLAHHQRDSAEARAEFEESLAIARQLGDRWTEAWVLHGLARVAYFENDSSTARSLGLQSLAIAQDVGDDWLVSWALHVLGLAAYIAGDYPTARDYYERSLRIRRELGFQEGIGIVLSLLGLVAIREGHMAEAEALLREGQLAMRPVTGPWSAAMLLSIFAVIAGRHGQPLRAVRLGAAASVTAERHQTPLIPLFEPLLAEGLESAKAALGQAAYEQAWAAGRALSVDDAIAEALNVGGEARSGPPDAPFGSLTPSERQVLRLLAGGRTTREIAQQLVVAVSTVDRHITHIYGKLGVRNRAEATALALSRGLA